MPRVWFGYADQADIWILPRAIRFPADWLASTSFLGAVAAIAIALAGAAGAFADDASSPLGTLKFDIPAQPLIEALQAYSVATGTQVMFETNSAQGFRSAPVQGEFTAPAALQMILADTDLRVRYTRANAITVAPVSAPDADEPPAHALAPADLALGTLNVSGGTDNNNRSRLGEYIGVVQADIQKALKKAKAASGEYRAEVRLWVDQSRIVQRAELSRSNGDKDRDAAVASALQGLILSQAAPANTPQPIRFMIAIRAL
ncbi:MAG: TonB C-terminal domain-containing protein [Bradyrhizobium sp.]